jgi:hypothetical protein
MARVSRSLAVGLAVKWRSGRVGGFRTKPPHPRDQHFYAERVGFEPTVSFPTHDFQSCRFGRSRTPPYLLSNVPNAGPRLRGSDRARYAEPDRSDAPCGGWVLRNGTP